MADEAERGATPTIEDLQRKVIELQDRLRDTAHEAKEHRLARNSARKRIEELEKAKPADASAELEALRKENRQLKHRTVFERVARESDAVTSGKALDTLWDALRYESDGDADPADLKARIEAVRPDYDFLFGRPAGAQAAAERPPGGATPARTETPAKAAGPGGSGRGGPADGAGTVKVRKSDLQSFDPAVNPMLDRHRARQVEQAKRDNRLVYVDE